MGRATYRKIITSPELIKQINPQNIKLMERFLNNFGTKRSPNSVTNYRSNLRMFFCWNVLENDNEFFIDIKKYQLMDFFDYGVTELQWHSQRYSQFHSCLSSFSAWIERMYDEKYPNFRNLLPKIEKPVKSVIRQKSVFTKAELDDLMLLLGRENKIQEQCLLALMMATGARLSELGRFTVPMIENSSLVFDDLFLETDPMQVKGMGTDGKHIERYIIKDMFMPYYNKWLPERAKIMNNFNQQHDSLFITRTGTVARVSTFRGWIENWNEYTSKPFYAHSMRHFWTTYLLGAGLEKELVQDLQKWSSDTLVSIYNDATAKDRTWKGLEKLRMTLNDELHNK